jgi:hypothetical protein
MCERNVQDIDVMDGQVHRINCPWCGCRTEIKLVAVPWKNVTIGEYVRPEEFRDPSKVDFDSYPSRGQLKRQVEDGQVEARLITDPQDKSTVIDISRKHRR